jgi:hypothetical protein
MTEITRRKMLVAGATTLGAVVAGITLRPSAEAGATQGHAHHHAHAAASAGAGWETVARGMHRGRLIEVETNGKKWRCRIDGKPLHPHVFDRQRDGRFSSHLLPYADPPDPVELVRALLDGEALELFRLG